MMASCCVLLLFSCMAFLNKCESQPQKCNISARTPRLVRVAKGANSMPKLDEKQRRRPALSYQTRPRRAPMSFSGTFEAGWTTWFGTQQSGLQGPASAASRARYFSNRSLHNESTRKQNYLKKLTRSRPSSVQSGPKSTSLLPALPTPRPAAACSGYSPLILHPPTLLILNTHHCGLF